MHYDFLRRERQSIVIQSPDRGRSARPAQGWNDHLWFVVGHKLARISLHSHNVLQITNTYRLETAGGRLFLFLFILTFSINIRHNLIGSPCEGH